MKLGMSILIIEWFLTLPSKYIYQYDIDLRLVNPSLVNTIWFNQIAENIK